MMRTIIAASMILSVFIPVVASDGFLEGPSPGSLSLKDRDQAFRDAMSTVVGCGGDLGSDRFREIEKVLAPMWRALPKNQHGRVEWRMLRYTTHRYFMKQSSLLIRGFEPARQVNESDMNAVGILSKQAPALAEMVFEGKQEHNGFTLEDAVAMVATLEQLIFDSETDLLEVAYKQQRQPVTAHLEHTELFNVMESYLVHWLVEGDARTAQVLLRNRTLLAQALPNWQDLYHFTNGMVKTLEFTRQRAPEPGHARVAMTQRYSFAEAHEAVGQITKTFASFWEAQCQDIKASLTAMDKTSTGRVSLSDFYGANTDGDWRFGESEAYLRELGALDESSSWRGPQVIIPNYLQGASNCIITTPNYLVCCVSECQDILHEVEDTVRAPVARPEDILRIVANITSFDDQPPAIDRALQSQLMRLSETHGGVVPLHGRLFQQWLHYVFPRECPFPHKIGATVSASVTEFGEQSLASQQEVRTHAAARNNPEADKIHSVENEQWMSQWSEDEELLAVYDLQAPWEGRGRLAFGSVALLVVAGMVATLLRGTAKDSAVGVSNAFEPKSHFV